MKEQKASYVLIAILLSTVMVLPVSAGEYTSDNAVVKTCSGSVVSAKGLWVQGLYNRAKQKRTSDAPRFIGRTRGIRGGMGIELNNVMTVGMGYGYTDTSVDDELHNIDIEGHHIFLYGKYQPDAWYANWLMGYSYSKYRDDRDYIGLNKLKYHTNSFSANLMTGYEFKSGFSPEVGFRYLFVQQEGYNDGVQRVRRDKNDLWAALAGMRYEKKLGGDKVAFTPHANLAVSYDIKSDNSKTNVEIIEGSNYQTGWKRLHRLGFEAGAGLMVTMGPVDLSFDYYGKYRQDFKNHTGMLKATYNF